MSLWQIQQQRQMIFVLRLLIQGETYSVTVEETEQDLSNVL